MDESETKKLPVAKILIGSIAVAWLNKEEYSKALALPTLLLVVIWGLSRAFPEQADQIPFALGLAMYLAGLSLFTVTCHRLILVSNRTSSLSIDLHRRLIVFALWIVILGFIYYLVTALHLTLMMNLPYIYKLESQSNLFYYTTIIASIPAMYVFGRLCLVFPTIAIDRRMNMADSWGLTRNNGWRIAVIVGAYPWLISIILWLVSREGATAVEQVLIAFLYLFGFAVEVFALSLTYQEIMKRSEIWERPL